jgi:S-adenosylmethionine:tRNA ribosyltransferase-isomerase
VSVHLERGAPAAGPNGPPPDAIYRTESYDFPLPPEQIATRPPAERDRARLLVLARKGPVESAIEHATFGDLERLLLPGDCLVLNETRVIKARLYGVRATTGGRIELLLVTRRDDGLWEALGRPGRSLVPGTRLSFADGTVQGEVVAVIGRGRRLVRFAGPGPVEDLLEQHGRVPIPPYLGRADDARDVTDYQTVYSRVPGAVAAPTAGLHFTPELLARIEARGVRLARLVLHPGPGTFRPVQAVDIREHELEPEAFALPEEAAASINAARAGGGRVVAVGTTVVRTLETQARAARAAGAPLGTVIAGSGESGLFIHPPAELCAIDALVTNFHLPRSTLLMLVCAFAGRDRVLAAYAAAVERGYLFFSYGDAMFIA